MMAENYFDQFDERPASRAPVASQENLERENYFDQFDDAAQVRPPRQERTIVEDYAEIPKPPARQKDPDAWNNPYMERVRQLTLGLGHAIAHPIETAGNVVEGMKSAVTLPYDVYSGKADLDDPATFDRAMSLGLSISPMGPAASSSRAAVAARAPKAPEALRRAAEGMTPAHVEIAARAIDDAAAQGIELPWTQAIQEASGGATNFPNLERYLAGSSGGGVFRQMMARRPEQIAAAGNKVLAALRPATPIPPVEAGLAAQEAARGALFATEKARTAATSPLYEAAEAVKVDAAEMDALLKDMNKAIAEDKTGEIATLVSSLRNKISEPKKLKSDDVPFDVPEFATREKFGPAPTSMLDFLRRYGLKDEGGDLKSMGFADKSGAAPKGSLKIIDKSGGVPMDEGRRIAVEAGYLEPNATVADFIDMLGGHPTYRFADMDEILRREEAARAAEGPSPAQPWEHDPDLSPPGDSDMFPGDTRFDSSPVKQERVPFLDIKNLHNARMVLREELGRPRVSENPVTKTQAHAVKPFMQRLTTIMENASPDYSAANKKFAEISKTVVKPEQAGPLGQIAKTESLAEQGARLFPEGKAALPGQEKALADTVKKIASRDPRAAESIVHSHLQSMFDESARLRQVPNPMGGANFASSLMGNAQEAANFRAIISALPDGRQRLAGVEKLVDVLRATGRAANAGSPTAPLHEIRREAQRGLVGTGVSFLHPLQTLREFAQKMEMGMNAEEMSKIITSRNSVGLFRDLAKQKNPASSKAQALAYKLVSLGKRPVRETPRLIPFSGQPADSGAEAPR